MRKFLDLYKGKLDASNIIELTAVIDGMSETTLTEKQWVLITEILDHQIGDLWKTYLFDPSKTLNEKQEEAAKKAILRLTGESGQPRAYADIWRAKELTREDMTEIDVEAKTVFIPKYEALNDADKIEVQAGIDKLPETTLNSIEWGEA